MGFPGEGAYVYQGLKWKIVSVAEMMRNSLGLGLSDCEGVLHVILRNLACLL